MIGKKLDKTNPYLLEKHIEEIILNPNLEVRDLYNCARHNKKGEIYKVRTYNGDNQLTIDFREILRTNIDHYIFPYSRQYTIPGQNLKKILDNRDVLIREKNDEKEKKGKIKQDLLKIIANPDIQVCYNIDESKHLYQCSIRYTNTSIKIVKVYDGVLQDYYKTTVYFFSNEKKQDFYKYIDFMDFELIDAIKKRREYKLKYPKTPHKDQADLKTDFESIKTIIGAFINKENVNTK